MEKVCFILAASLFLAACNRTSIVEKPDRYPTEDITLRSVAKMLSELPLEKEHLQEVYNAAGASAGNGYDEEYLVRDIFESPGCGVGDDLKTRAESRSSYAHPLRDLIREHLESTRATKSGISDVEDYINRLESSGFQLYCPFSENWDGETLPIITFDPGYGAESNYGYEMIRTGNGIRVVDSVFVDEAVAMKRPVWVVNTNDDSAFTPLELYSKGSIIPETKGITRKLLLKSFKMLRNYDSWFGGASEFFVKLGTVDRFTASTEAEMRLYNPSVTDFMIVIRRSEKGKDIPFNTIMLSDFSNQLDMLAFLVTEDDGGTTTSWKCSATVKIQSKSYGFDLDIPYHDKDDIVWRGQLAATFFQEADIVSGRFGDVEISFALE